MISVTIVGSSLTTILAQYMTFMVELWFREWTGATLVHFDDFVNHDKLKCGELYCVSCMGHVRDNE